MMMKVIVSMRWHNDDDQDTCTHNSIDGKAEDSDE